MQKPHSVQTGVCGQPNALDEWGGDDEESQRDAGQGSAPPLHQVCFVVWGRLP